MGIKTELWGWLNKQKRQAFSLPSLTVLNVLETHLMWCAHTHTHRKCTCVSTQMCTNTTIPWPHTYICTNKINIQSMWMCLLHYLWMTMFKLMGCIHNYTRCLYGHYVFMSECLCGKCKYISFYQPFTNLPFTYHTRRNHCEKSYLHFTNNVTKTKQKQNKKKQFSSS